MKKNKYLKIGILSLFFVFMFVGHAYSQVTLSLRYSNADSKYHVYLTATQALGAVPNPKLTDGSSIITVTAPTSGNAANPLTIGTVTSVSPIGIWSLDVTHRNNGDLVSANGGGPAPQNTDFFVFIPSGDFTSITYTVGQEVELFNFDVTGYCTGTMDLLPSDAQTATINGNSFNIGSYYSVKGYPGSIGTNHFSSTYNMVSACPSSAVPNIVTTIGQPATPFVVGQPSNVPVTLTNTGNASATGPITTTITLPTGTSAPASFTPVAGTTCATSGQTVTCTTTGPISQTTPNNSVVLPIPVTPAPSTANTSPSPFTAVVTPISGETSTADNTAPPMTPNSPVTGLPDLVTAIGQPATPFVVGQPSNVPVTITNQGTGPANGPITTTITVPTGMTVPATFTSNGNTCTTSGQTVTCTNAGPLSQTVPNNTTTIQVPMTPTAAIAGTSPQTTATTGTTGSPAESNTSNNPATPMIPTTPVAGVPDLVTTIGQPSPSLVAGQPSNIPVTVTNQGSGPANGPITTTITLPTNTSAPASFTSNGNTCTTSGQTITCTNAGPLSNLTPNNSTVINVPVTAAPSTVGTNPGPFTASPSAPNEPVGNTGNNPAQPMTPTNPVIAAAAPDLVTTIGAVSPSMIVGQTSNLPVTITNIGTAPTTGTVSTTITLPAGISTQTLFVTNGYTCSTSGQMVNCFSNTPLSNVTPNNAVLLQIPIIPAASTVGTTPIFNANTTGGGEPVGNTTNNAAPPTTSGTVSPVPASDLVTTIGQPLTPFVVGTPSNVPVTIKNQGNAPDNGPITSNITLPAGFSTPAIFSPAAGTTCTTTGQNITCTTAGPLSQTVPNNTTTFNLPITPAASTIGTTPQTTGTTSSPNEPAANTGNNPATPMSPTTPVAAAPAPDLVTFVGQPATPFVAGSPSNVPVTVINQGTAPANGPVTTSITLPTGFSAPAIFTSNGNTCTTTGQIVSCSNPSPLSNIAPGNSMTIQVPVTPAASTVGTTPQTNATTSAPNEPATSTGNNPATPMSPTIPVAAAPAPDLVTTIGQPLTPFVVGSPSIVPVTVANIGSAPANGPINTTITLPTGMSAPAIFSPVAGTSCTTTGQTVSCTTTGPLSQTAPNNTIVINVPVTPAASTVGTSPSPFTATPTAPNETNTSNNAAAPMTPTTPVAPAAVVNVKLSVKLFLQGAYDAGTGMMRDDLRSKGFLPTAQPYSAMARTSYHTGTETVASSVLAATGANAIVDWVLIELRTGVGAATRVATRAALVQRDGDVVDVDGVSPVTFANRAAASYYVVATHRNHLGVMSEVLIPLTSTPTICDFTGAYDGYGSNAMRAIGNLNALWAGNANHTGVTHKSLIFSGASNDPDAVKNNVLTAPANSSALDFSFVPMGYHIGDTNLDGDVKYQGTTNDLDEMIFFNVMTHPANGAPSPLHLITENH